MRFKLAGAAIVAVAVLVVSACDSDDIIGTGQDDGRFVGYMYTSTNNSAGNAVIALGRTSSGALAELPGSPYSTGGVGDAAEGDFDTQWSLRIVGDYLLAVNAGGNPINGSISVFRINRADGSLVQVDQDPSAAGVNNMDSRGIRAVSIASSGTGTAANIIVANQHSNPNYQLIPAEAHGTITTSTLRNLAVFTFNTTTGLLQFSRIGATYSSGDNGGPTTVEFNPAGTKVAVSTWGVTHFVVPDPNLTLQKPGRLYLYDFASGNMNQTGVFEEIGISGNIGLSWSPNGQFVYLSNFNLHSSKENNSVTVHDGVTGAKIQNFGTADRNDEACWTWVSLDKQKLYVASFGQNVVSVFDIGSDGRLGQSLTPNFFRRGGAIPAADTKDLYEAGGQVYALGAFQTHSISVFDRAANGSLSEHVGGSPYRIPSSLNKTKEEHAFVGLTGFDK